MPSQRRLRLRRQRSNTRRRSSSKPIHRLNKMDLSGLPFEPDQPPIADDLSSPVQPMSLEIPNDLLTNAEIDTFAAGDLDLPGDLDLDDDLSTSHTSEQAADLELPPEPPPPPPMDLDISFDPNSIDR